MKIQDINVKKEIITGLEKMGFEEFSEIQVEAIPPALEGRDILGQAQTGTGKTAAFCVPVLEGITNDVDDVQALMLAPTRELAIQITEELKKISGDLNIDVVSVYGGDPIDKQMKLLKNKPQIVVGTPGRVIDFMNRKKLKIHNVKYFILDEVDEMLNMGFIDDVELVTKAMPKHKQTLLFSATLPDKIKKISDKYLNDPIHIKVAAKSMTVDKVEQKFIVIKKKQKAEVLSNLLLVRKGQKIIVFTQTKRDCDELYDFLMQQKYRVGKIHGDIAQANRTKTINEFRKGNFEVLIATDVVARGIDIDGVQLVINFELPQDIEYYIHRIGRTGRGNSEKGEAITLVSPAVYKNEFRHYPKRLKCDITEIARPTHKQIVEKLQWDYYNQIDKAIESEKVDEVYANMAAMLLANYSEHQLVPMLLKKLFPELSKDNRDNLILPSQKQHGEKSKRCEGESRRNRGDRRRGNGGSDRRRGNGRGNRRRGNGENKGDNFKRGRGNKGRRR